MIATRSLVLFQAPLHLDSPSTWSNPNTPTTARAPPTPISMPIQSLMYGDTDCAYFLLQHILSASLPLGGIGKEVSAAAEVMVWNEIDKAKMFVRALGEWYANFRNEKIEEKDLRALAKRFGVGLQAEKEGNGEGLMEIDRSLRSVGFSEHSGSEAAIVLA